MEALPTRYNCINCTLIPTVQSKFSVFCGNNRRKRIILSSCNDYALGPSIYGPELDKRIRHYLKKIIHGEWMKRILK